MCLLKKIDAAPFANTMSFDSLPELTNMSISAKQNTLQIPVEHYIPHSFDFTYLLVFVFLAGIVFHIFRFVKDFVKLQKLLKSSIPYKSSNKLSIQITDRCLIPFSVRFLNKAYIVLPVSLLTSSTHKNLAIAHEGQHHRQGDCCFAYLMECVRVVFWGNPGVQRWHRLLSELQELACDEALVGHPMVCAHDYGNCLFKVAQTVSTYSESHLREFACTVGMAWNSENNEGSFLKRRICMLSQYHLNVSKQPLFKLALTSLAVLAPLCTAYAAKGVLPNPKLDISTLDSKIQKIASEEITKAVKLYKAKSGVVAVADPKTGKVIAFAEYNPEADSESWASRIFAPASLVKPFLAAAAIDESLASEAKVYDCRGPYTVGGETFSNYDPNFAFASLTDAVAKSVNICMIKLAQDVGSSTLRDKLGEFGFDMNSAWHSDRSDALQLAHLALGRNIPLTMGTLSKAYAILANKGRLGSAAVIKESTAEAVTRMMVEVVERGTGKQAALNGIRVAGKTGTSGNEQGSLAFFGGYAPAEDPRFVSVVIIEGGMDSKGEYSGGALASPVFSAVAARSL